MLLIVGIGRGGGAVQASRLALALALMLAAELECTCSIVLTSGLPAATRLIWCFVLLAVARGVLSYNAQVNWST